MLPMWPNFNRVPVWFWLLIVAAFFGFGLYASTEDFDADAAMNGFLQTLTAALFLGGLFWIGQGAKVLLRLRALDQRAVEAEGRVVDVYGISEQVRSTGSFGSGSRTVTQHYLIYRFGHPDGETTTPTMCVDAELAKSLRKGGPIAVRYLPDRPQVSAPKHVAIRQVKVLRALQLVAGIALVVWSAGWLAPGVF